MAELVAELVFAATVAAMEPAEAESGFSVTEAMSAPRRSARY